MTTGGQAATTGHKGTCFVCRATAGSLDGAGYQQLKSHGVDIAKGQERCLAANTLSLRVLKVYDDNCYRSPPVRSRWQIRYLTVYRTKYTGLSSLIASSTKNTLMRRQMMI